MISFKNINFVVSSSGKLLLQPWSRRIASKCGSKKAIMSKKLSVLPYISSSSLLMKERNYPIGLAIGQIRMTSTSSTITGEGLGQPRPEDGKRAQRGQFSHLSCDDVTFFSNLLGKHRVLTNESEIGGYNVDWLRTVKGHSRLVLRPRNTSEVSTILTYCYDRNLAVVPQGGNTSIVGGGIAVHDEIIISTSLMNKVEYVDEWSGVLVCQSGCILENINEHLSQYDLIMPLDLGAKESCQIGGNVSTNAGGLRVIRYGNLHSSLVGIEVVLADGTVLDCMNIMKKDNTGFHLKHLFVGSEGTLGIVTKVAIHCPPKPKSVQLAFLGVESFQNVLETFRLAKQELGEVLSACEYFDKETLCAVYENLSLKSPIGDSFPFYMMIETSGSNSKHDEEKVTMFLESAMEKKFVTDGTIASQPSHVKSMWSIRERFAEALLKDGHLTVYDFSIPLESFNEMVEETRDFLGAMARRVTGFGHLGDSNLHLNVTMSKFNPDTLAKAEPFVYNFVAQRKGSISSEHGLGAIKRDYIYYSKSPQAVFYMRELKKLLDPKGILNPYKVIPDRQM